jgi:hypothetical protein
MVFNSQIKDMRKDKSEFKFRYKDYKQISPTAIETLSPFYLSIILFPGKEFKDLNSSNSAKLSKF